ncbi:MAG: sulfite exporter TauE/SafE family protein, partial [Proteobacteria bacterium]|nr:sulfite exporter TauE/SafE family protein [Pseudomonadota bacterium]
MVEGHVESAPPAVEANLPSTALVRGLWLLILAITVIFLLTWSWGAVANNAFDVQRFAIALAVGAAAQLVDGALGMAYGITANSLLLAAGLSPAAATASVHVAEAFTTASSGLSHWSLGNIDRRIFRRLVVPGVLGGISGVLLIAWVDGARIRPFIAAYLLLMGFYLIYRAFRTVR